MKTDVYTRVTDKIIADLEKGELTWRKPWSAGHLAGRIERPLRHNGIPYQGINIILLWAATAAREFTAPLWMSIEEAGGPSAYARMMLDEAARSAEWIERELGGRAPSTFINSTFISAISAQAWTPARYRRSRDAHHRRTG